MNHNIVTETSENLRALARVSLQGKWKLAAIATAVYMVAILVPTFILDALFGGADGASSLSTVYNFIIAGPFTIGYSMFCMNIFRGKECEVAQVFYGFEKFLKAMGLYCVMLIFVILWSFLFLIPGIIAAYRYSQSFFIMIDHPEYGILQCLAESKRMMVGNKMKLFGLELSFIGWGILAMIPIAIMTFILVGVNPSVLTINICVLLASVGTLWLTPYITVAGIGFYELAAGNLRPGVIEVAPISVEGTGTQSSTTEMKTIETTTSESVSLEKNILTKETDKSENNQENN